MAAKFIMPAKVKIAVFFKLRVYKRVPADKVETSVSIEDNTAEARKKAFAYACALIESDPRKST